MHTDHHCGREPRSSVPRLRPSPYRRGDHMFRIRSACAVLLTALVLSACASTSTVTPTPVAATGSTATEQAAAPGTAAALTPAASPESATAASASSTEGAATETAATTAASTATAATTAASTATAATTAASTATYQTADCKFKVPQGLQVTCGYLSVPEDRSQPNSAMLKLHVAVFKSSNPHPAPDPIIYLEGGPGGHALETVPLSFQDRFAPFLKDHDFIMFDQRGTGYSQPALDCQEIADLSYATLNENINAVKSSQLNNEASLKCRDRLVKAGVNLQNYTSASNAADVNDLRVALGYKQWNLYGISYGTRLALTTMRDFPTGIRSVILDSTVPVQDDIDAATPASADRAFNTLFSGCAASTACNQAYPNLKTTFYQLVDQLNQKPVSTNVTDPLSGKEYPVLLNGDILISTLFQALYDSSAIPILPRAIVQASQGKSYSDLARLTLLNTVETKFISYGMYFSVQCGEDVHFETRDELAAADHAFPQEDHVFDGTPLYDLCQSWGARPAGPIEHQAVQSDIPTMIMAGQYDPITPPQNGQLVGQTLSKSFFFQYPGMGHGVSTDDPCPQSMAQAFFNNPTTKPASDCIQQMQRPDFAVPLTSVTMQPFQDQQSGISGVAPAGWV